MLCEEGSCRQALVSKDLDSGHSLRAQKLVVMVSKADPQDHCSRAEAGTKEPGWDGQDLGVFQSAQPIALMHG